MSNSNGIPIRRVMRPRDPHEPHRTATSLELFFDLVFVVAIASAAAGWHHGLVEGHYGDLLGFVMVFFAIWWAWMNYTWFASAYECDDVIYRLLTFTIMIGSLMLAAGVPDLFSSGQSVLLVAGYALMRFAMVAMWLRAAAGHPEGSQTAQWYAGGIAVVQVLWIGRLLVHGQGWLMLTFWLLVVAELMVPPLAERHGNTPHHPHHIAERYSLLTIIVLGEVILASVQAAQGGLEKEGEISLLPVLGGGVLIVFSMWWLYFKRDLVPLFQHSARTTFAVGYSHYAIFASIAATGAALAAAVEVVHGQGHTSARAVGFALGGAVALFTAVLTAMHVALGAGRRERAAGTVVTAGALAIGVSGLPVGVTALLIGVLLTLAVAHHVISSNARAEPEVEAAARVAVEGPS